MRIEAMLFHLTAEDHIRTSDEQRRTETDGGRSSFASEQELQEVASEWPMKRLVEIWNRLPGVEPVARFTDRKTVIARIWRALQPKPEKGSKPARRASRSQHRPVFREGSKAAQVCTLLLRPEGSSRARCLRCIGDSSREARDRFGPTACRSWLSV